jgi:hypothetical protein
MPAAVLHWDQAEFARRLQAEPRARVARSDDPAGKVAVSGLAGHLARKTYQRAPLGVHGISLRRVGSPSVSTMWRRRGQLPGSRGCFTPRRGSRRGRADRALPSSGLAKILGDAGAVFSRHWLVFDNRLAQRPIRSDKLVPIAAVALVEQFA